MIINKKKKKKGFTLIELIAVIAILAILGAILVPKISGYTDSAKKGKAVADAKIIVSAVAAYNADKDADVIVEGTLLSAMTDIVGAGKTIESIPTEFAGTTTLTQLKKMANGGKDNITLTGGIATPKN